CLVQQSNSEDGSEPRPPAHSPMTGTHYHIHSYMYYTIIVQVSIVSPILESFSGFFDFVPRVLNNPLRVVVVLRQVPQLGRARAISEDVFFVTFAEQNDRVTL